MNTENLKSFVFLAMVSNCDSGESYLYDNILSSNKKSWDELMKDYQSMEAKEFVKHNFEHFCGNDHDEKHKVAVIKYAKAQSSACGVLLEMRDRMMMSAIGEKELDLSTTADFYQRFIKLRDAVHVASREIT